MADPKDEKAAAAPADAGAGGGNQNKIVMGIMALNMVFMLAVAIVLYLGQQKQAQQQTLDQVAQGAAASSGHGGGGEHGGGGGHGGGGEHGGGGGHGGAAAEAPVSDTRFFSLGDFTANLAGPTSTHYVKVSVNFEINKETDEEEMKARKPQFRDKVISLLNSKQPADLQTSDGRNYLKEEIKKVSNTFLKKGKVEGVYFSAFVIN